MRFEMYKRGDQWRWRFRAANGKIIASGEGYKNRGDCVAAINLIRKSWQAEIEQIEEVPDTTEELSHGM